MPPEAAPAAPAAAPAAPAAPPAAPAAPATPPSTPAAPSAPKASSFDDLVGRAAAKRDKPEGTPTPKKDEGAPAAPSAPKDPKHLRAELDKVNGELTTSRSTISELQRKIADWEARGKDTTALSETLAREQKEKQELQALIRRLKREVSPEFKDKYDKPFNQAAEFAKRIVEQMSIEEGDIDNPHQRQATWQDFVALWNMPYNKAVAAAKQMFGDGASSVIQHLTDLQKLEYTRSEALKEEQAKWKEIEEREVAEASQRKTFIENTFTKVSSDISNKHPDWFLEDPKDKEGNELLKEGFALVDAKPASMEEQIVRDANIRLYAAAFPRLVHKLARLTEQLAERDQQIAEMNGSLPGTTKTPTGGSPPAPSGKKWQDDLKESMA